MAAILAATLKPDGGGQSFSGCVICGERGLSDLVSNILLFAPFGFALARRGHPAVMTAAIGALFSLSIELAQLSIITGRDANIGDLVANSLGATAGWSIGRHRLWWLRKENSARRCIALTAATLGLLIAGLALFIPSLPEAAYYMQWTARFGNMGVYEGEVLSTRIGTLDIPGNQRIERTDSVRRMLFTRPIAITATADRRADMAPIMSIYDEHRREIMLLGAQRADLIYRYRMLADELRFGHGDIRVHQAFEGVPHDSVFHLTWRIDRSGYCLDVEGRSGCGRGFTVGDTWTLLMALDWGTDERKVLSTIWLWILFVPAGLLAGDSRALLLAAGLATLALMAAPVLMGFALTPAYQIVAALLGLATGSLLKRRYGNTDG